MDTTRLRRRRFPLLGRSRSFFSCCILLSEALFSRLAFPVVVPHPPAVYNQPASKLPEHGARCYDSNLPGAIRIRKYFLMDQIVLLRLCRNDLVERSVLVEE